MARIRTVKPEFFTSRTTALLSYGARLTFIGLWTHVDDAGRCLAECRLLKAAIWPLDDSVDTAQVLQWLGELSAVGLVICYTGGHNNLIQVRSWDHQRINRPTPSRFPPPTDEEVEAAQRLSEASVSAHGGLTTGRERKGREQGKERMAPVGANGNSVEPPRETASGQPVRAPSWVDEAHALYAEHIGLVSHGHLGKALKPAVGAYGWPSVQRWFTAYCTTRPYQKRDGSFWGDSPRDKPEDAVKDTRFCSPDDFAKNLATWRERCAPMVTT